MRQEWNEMGADSPMTRSGSRQVRGLRTIDLLFMQNDIGLKILPTIVLLSRLRLSYFFIYATSRQASVRWHCAMYECSRWIFHRRNKSRRSGLHFDAFHFIMDTNRGRDTRHTPKHSALCNATAPFACPKWFSHVPLLPRAYSVLLFASSLFPCF